MKTLAEEILEALPNLVAKRPLGASVEDIANLLCVSPPHVRAAMAALHGEGRASLARWPGSKRRYLVPTGHDFGARRRACPNCQLVFDQPKKRKRVTCGRSCAVAWSWKQPGVAAVRRSSIRAQKATPKARAQQAEHNRRRWSDQEQHERLSEQNRQQWSDPVSKAKRSASIQAANGSPEARAAWSLMRKEMWADPEYRARCTAGIKASKSTPEARALFSELLRARWQDPVLREKYLAAVRKNSKAIAERRRRVAQEVPA